ncbi:TRAP transporter small permease [Falsiroseomonas selenitidurans]|uniref:TRAP transporter small permease protein n=1 Tax=Falsiroseomonas selenitidurans TaxID=2716335 RepID=A0ABX1E6W5_9PROT|nr:TRAP transporter small permease subunit [Falsiroseomonas selenitidurans]NKC31527.1 TRAP transporter small permease subunit [Falsiroseomonas selenitidurans]
MRRFESGLLWLNRFLCAALLVAACALVFANVVLRYGFGVSLAWAEEASRYMMIWLAFLAAGLALREGAHIAVDLLPEALPEPAARWLRALILAAIAGFLGLLLVLGINYADFAMMQRSPVLRLSMGLVYLAIPVGTALMLLHLALMAPRFVLRPRDEAAQVRAAEMGSL